MRKVSNTLNDNLLYFDLPPKTHIINFSFSKKKIHQSSTRRTWIKPEESVRVTANYVSDVPESFASAIKNSTLASRTIRQSFDLPKHLPF